MSSDSEKPVEETKPEKLKLNPVAKKPEETSRITCI